MGVTEAVRVAADTLHVLQSHVAMPAPPLCPLHMYSANNKVYIPFLWLQK